MAFVDGSVKWFIPYPEIRSNNATNKTFRALYMKLSLTNKIEQLT